MERLSGLDASFLYIETDTMHMQVAFVAICSTESMPGGYSFNKIFKHMDSRTQRDSALRRRLVEVPFNLHHPLWIDDPDFDVADHVHRELLTKTFCRQELGRRVGEMMSVPLDRNKPLWEARVFEGLEKDKFAFVVKIHHAMVDGVSGTGLMNRLFDMTPDHVEPEVIHRSSGDWLPNKAELFSFAIGSRIGRTKKFLNLLGDSFDGIKALILNKDDKAARSRPLGAPKTHFNNRISAIRDAAFVELSLVEVKEVKNKTNATVNDVILATCGGALREYLKEMNELPERPLIAMVPISVRKADKQSITNNQVSGMWSTLATHVNSPLERLRLIHEDTKDAKDEHDAVGADLIPDWAEFNNPSAMQFAIKLYASSGLANKAPVHNTIISNVPGPRDARYFAGAKVETLYPIGPVMEGVGLNISLASYQDVIGISIHVDEHLVPKVDSIAAALTKSFAELKKAAGVQQAKKATVTKLQERVESAETGDAAAQVS